jgi:hypothetical protein
MSAVTFRWLPPKPHPDWYSEQMGVFLRTNRDHPNGEEAVTRWAFRVARRHGRIPSSYGAITLSGIGVAFKGELTQEPHAEPRTNPTSG